MIIETKFNLNDKLFFALYKSKEVKSGIVTDIILDGRIFERKDKDIIFINRIKYKIDDSTIVQEFRLFKEESELLKCL